MAEKAILEEALQQKEACEQRLVEELESTRAQLQELGEEHALLQRQRDALSASLGEPEKGGSRVVVLNCKVCDIFLSHCHNEFNLMGGDV